MFLQRGFHFTHETIRDWEVRFGSLLAEHLRRQRRKRAGTHWYVDETYVAVKGQWVYVPISCHRQRWATGHTMLSEHRDMAAAKAFFESARTVVGYKPKQVTTDGRTPYPRAIQEILGKRMKPCVISCLGNPIEEDHRGIKQRYYPTLAFKAQKTAVVFCRAYGEVRNYFRPKQKMGQEVSLSGRRELFTGRYFKLQDQFCVAATLPAVRVL